jgi:hypothetical protein
MKYHKCWKTDEKVSTCYAWQKHGGFIFTKNDSPADSCNNYGLKKASNDIFCHNITESEKCEYAPIIDIGKIM